MRDPTDAGAAAGPAVEVQDIRPGLLLLGCLLLSTCIRAPSGEPSTAEPDLFAVLAAMAAIAVTCVAVGRRIPLLVPARWVAWLTSGCWAGLVLFSTVYALTYWVRSLIQRGSSEAEIVLGGAGATLLLVALAVLALLGRWRWVMVVAVAYLATTTGLVHLLMTDIDVHVYDTDAAAALLRGENPYAITIADPTPPEVSAVYYAPGMVVDGRVLFGYAYPPVSLLLMLPGALLGDVRFAMCLALGVTAALLYRRDGDAFSRRCAVFVLLIPGIPYVLTLAWIEPLCLVLLAAAVVGGQRRWWGAPYLLGAFLVSKQYLVVLAPLLWLLRPLAARGRGGVPAAVTRVVGAGALLTVPFLVWSPEAFWHSLVEFQLLLPFRSDSFSLLAWSVVHTGWPPPSVYGWLPLVGGGLTGLVLAWRAPRTPSAFAATTSATLMVTTMLSKVAFANYFFLAAGALLIAACTWRADPENDGPAA